MRKDADKIQFETRAEIGAVMDAIAKLVKLAPDEKTNGTLKRLYDLLDVMEMEW